MQSMMEIIARHYELLWVGGELKQVIRTATHKNGALWCKHDWQRIHLGRDVIIQGLYLFFGGRIMGQELLRHIACANRQRFRKGWCWTFALNSLCAPASTIHDEQR